MGNSFRVPSVQQLVGPGWSGDDVHDWSQCVWRHAVFLGVNYGHQVFT